MDTNMSANNTSKNLLNSDVEIKGNIKFAGELTFEGKLDGEIHTDGVLTLGDSAVINGNIVAQSVLVRGKITGNISAKDKIEIKAKAEVVRRRSRHKTRHRGGRDLRRQNRGQSQQGFSDSSARPSG